MNHPQWLNDVLSGAVGSAGGGQKVGEGNETLSETLAAGLGETLVRAFERPNADVDAVRAAFLDPQSLTHLKLAHLVGRGTHERDVAAFLQRAEQVERQYGRMLWSRDLLRQDLDAERRGRVLPRARNAPRLFISYRWGFDAAYDEDLSLDVHEFAGWLFGRGYDLVYDRDPRHVDKGLGPAELLWLLPGCSQMIAIVTDGYQERVLDRAATSPVCQEFALAPHLYRANRQPTLLGLWIQGEQLREPVFSRAWIVDCRDRERFDEKKGTSFPERRFEVTYREEDGTTHVTGPMTRVNVQPTVDRLFHERAGRRVAVTDVTMRPSPTPSSASQKSR